MNARNLPKEELDKFFYHRIIDHSGDYVGRIAYTLYKENKIEYIIKYKKSHGDYPLDSDLKIWQENECLDSKIENYKSNAEKITNEFINILNLNKENDFNKKHHELFVKENNINEREKILKDNEKKIKSRDKYCNQKPNHWFENGLLNILHSVIASFIFIIVCYFIIKYWDGSSDLLKNLIKTQ